jgi:periplasmic protein TonB
MSLGRRGSSTLISLAIHAVVVAILFLLGGYSVTPRVRFIADQRVIPLLDPLTDLGRDSGGGGGNHSQTPASKGRLPPYREFKAPLPVAASVKPPLLVEPAPSLSADIHIDSHLLQFGDPNGVPGPPSSGPGDGGGLGPGHGPGVGANRGPGYGDGGPGPGVGGGRVTAPVLVWKVDPDYSDPARAAKVQGLVVLRVEIDGSGHIRDVRVDRGLGLGLDEKAMEAVRRWRFLPGTRNGRAVATTAVVEVHFRLL